MEVEVRPPPRAKAPEPGGLGLKSAVTLLCGLAQLLNLSVTQFPVK